MHTRILIAGDDQMTIEADGMLLKEKGMYVYPVSNFNNIPEFIAEIRPDIVFFDMPKRYDGINDAYKSMSNYIRSKDIPIIYTGAEDELYVVIGDKDRKRMSADNVVDAVKMALNIDVTHFNKHYPGRKCRLEKLPLQLQLPLCAG